jgi:uncharacterized protein YndB with AHSA1/START domain
MAAGDAGAGAAEGEVVITRIFDAPLELVWKAWTEPERVMRWWGPQGYTIPYCTIDLRTGGVMHFCMRSAEGQEIWCGGVFHEVVEPERIVSTSYFSDEQGNVVRPERYGMSAAWPAETLVTVTFADLDGRTLVTLQQRVGPVPADERASAQQGWIETFDRLAEYVANA